jgi:SAM-dependent methyltransferase
MHNDLRTRLRLAYDAMANERDSREPDAWKIEERASFLSLLQREGKRTLLEIGAGTGRDSKFFQDQGLDVTCTDLSTEHVRLCKQKGLNALVADFANLPFLAQSFDAVYALNCLLHVPNAELTNVLQGIAGVMKQDGLFFLGVYGGRDEESIREDDDYEPKRFFSLRSDDRLLERAQATFELHSFRRVPLLYEDESRLHFQSLALRKRESNRPS